MRKSVSKEEAIAEVFLGATMGTYLHLGWTPAEIIEFCRATIDGIIANAADPEKLRAVRTLLAVKAKRKPMQKRRGN